MTQLGFSFNADECIGCKVCVAACKDVHALPVGYKLRKVVTGEAGTWVRDANTGLLQPVDVFSYSVSYACMHCSKPACMEKCPKRAISKDVTTGIVSIDQELCIGCGSCVRACPWEAPVLVPRIDGTFSSRKCDLCHDLLAKGEEPACVAACLMRCLKLEEFPDAPSGSAADASRLRPDPLVPWDAEAGAHYRFTPHREMLRHPDAEVRIHSMPEEYQNG